MSMNINMENITISTDLPLYLPVVKRLSEQLGIVLSSSSNGGENTVADLNDQTYALIVIPLSIIKFTRTCEWIKNHIFFF